MKKAHELPQAVNNLRAIWDTKKVEMQFTQIEAAKELGWSQGAISHYLNNITDLGPAAVVKFANFLGVDPLEIDPDIAEFLPNTQTVVAAVSSSNLNKKINKKIHHNQTKTQLKILIEDGTLIFSPDQKQPHTFKSRPGEICMMKVCSEKEAPESSWWFIQKKNETAGHVYYYTEIPSKAIIKKKYAVNFMSWIAANRTRG